MVDRDLKALALAMHQAVNRWAYLYRPATVAENICYTATRDHWYRS